ncbi:MAG: redoxin domain-containing protein [Candidatus Acidiferrales bacterium]
MELAALEESFAEFQSLGATLLALSPQLPEHCAATREKAHLSFDVLSDTHNEVARRFGIVFRLPDDLAEIYKKFNMDLAKFNGDPSWELPLPARYVIDRENILRAADVNVDYTIRPEPGETLAVLRNLRGAASRGER